jgi:hypothetical protein
VAKLTDAGSTSSFTWAQQIGGMGDESATAIAVSGTSLYVAGYFNSLAASLGSNVLINAESRGVTSDVFVTKLVDAGNNGSFVWAIRAGGTASEASDALAISGTNVYVTGGFGGATTILGSTTLANASGTNTQGYDAFVAKISDAGTSASFTWAQRIGGGGDDSANALAVSGTNVYVAGYFSAPTINFGPITLTNANSGGFTGDTYVAKLTDAGNTGSFIWAQQAGGVGSDLASRLAVSGGNVYVVGYFSSASPGPTSTTFGNTTLTAFGSADVFVAKIVDAGNTSSFLWAQQAGGTGPDYANALLVNGTNIYVGGSTTPSASFGDFTIATPINSQVAFLASLTDTAPLATRNSPQLASLTLHPNPAHAHVTIQVLAVPGATQAMLTLTNAIGRVVRTYSAALPANGLRQELDLAGLAPGLYALRVEAGAATAMRRFVVN